MVNKTVSQRGSAHLFFPFPFGFKCQVSFFSDVAKTASLSLMVISDLYLSSHTFLFSLCPHWYQWMFCQCRWIGIRCESYIRSHISFQSEWRHWLKLAVFGLPLFSTTKLQSRWSLSSKVSISWPPPLPMPSVSKLHNQRWNLILEHVCFLLWPLISSHLFLCKTSDWSQSLVIPTWSETTLVSPSLPSLVEQWCTPFYTNRIGRKKRIMKSERQFVIQSDKLFLLLNMRQMQMLFKKSRYKNQSYALFILYLPLKITIVRLSICLSLFVCNISPVFVPISKQLGRNVSKSLLSRHDLTPQLVSSWGFVFTFTFHFLVWKDVMTDLSDKGRLEYNWSVSRASKKDTTEQRDKICMILAIKYFEPSLPSTSVRTKQCSF